MAKEKKKPTGFAAFDRLARALVRVPKTEVAKKASKRKKRSK